MKGPQGRRSAGGPRPRAQQESLSAALSGSRRAGTPLPLRAGVGALPRALRPAASAGPPRASGPPRAGHGGSGTSAPSAGGAGRQKSPGRPSEPGGALRPRKGGALASGGLRGGKPRRQRVGGPGSGRAVQRLQQPSGLDGGRRAGPGPGTACREPGPVLRTQGPRLGGTRADGAPASLGPGPRCPA